MDYEFSYDYLGKPVARISMGHEAFGLWLSQEIGADPAKVDAVLQDIEQLTMGKIQQKVMTGSEYQLCLSQEEAEVISHVSRIETEEVPEEVELDETDSYAVCGLQDFELMLLSWQSFYLRG